MPATGSCEVTPGLLIADGAIVTNAKLRQVASPVVKVGDGQIGTAQLDADAVRSLVFTPGINRNALINGNFDVWQRGGYVNGVGLPTALGQGAGHVFGADRWSLGTPAGASYRSISRGTFVMDQTDVPNAPTYYLRWGQSTGEPTPTLSQPLEDVRTLAGKPVTVSWWMKSNLSGTVTCRLKQSFGGVDPVERVIAATTGGAAAMTLGANWEKFEAHFTVPTLAGYIIGGDDSALILEFVMPSSATFIIDYAQVQLEQSATATAFETYSNLFEASRCQRYYESSGGVMWTSLVTGQPSFFFNVRKYRAPTLTLVEGYAGAGGEFDTILDVGYRQSVANSVVTVFFINADAEIYL